MEELAPTIWLGELSEAGAALRQALGDRPRASQVVIVSDDTVLPLHGGRLRASLSTEFAAVRETSIPPGENSKSMEMAGRLYRSLADCNVDRDAMIVALGGGVVSDLAGFVAATWMRGIRWAVCPTTLESQIDAAIGGKTGFNLPGAKNMVGAFHQPLLILIDPGVLGTLSNREFKAGLAESVKHALITSEEFFTWHEKHASAILGRDCDAIDELIRRNVAIKSTIVDSDARETSDRRILLNFGHTIGHGIEECCGYSLRHGECVALGMLAECRLAVALGLLEAATADRVKSLLVRLGLPTTQREKIAGDRMLETIKKDKKNQAGGIRCVLLEGIGLPIVCDEVPEKPLMAAAESIFN